MATSDGLATAHEQDAIVQLFTVIGDTGQVLYFLSGLTCTDENVTTKSGIQRRAAEEGIAIIAPDTSPRGLKMYALLRVIWQCYCWPDMMCLTLQTLARWDRNNK